MAKVTVNAVTELKYAMFEAIRQGVNGTVDTTRAYVYARMMARVMLDVYGGRA